VSSHLNPLIVSFYTSEPYYQRSYESLVSDLDRLGLRRKVVLFHPDPHARWIEICRYKIEFLTQLRKEERGLIYWIDVDSRLISWPDFLNNVSADIIGFQRGYRPIIEIGYGRYNRFWEPSFLGFQDTNAAHSFLDNTFNSLQQCSEAATDDYFIEEAWRKTGHKMNLQIIPSSLAITNRSFVLDSGNYSKPFIVIQSSGNVASVKSYAKRNEKIVRNLALFKKPKSFLEDPKAMVRKTSLPFAGPVRKSSALIRSAQDFRKADKSFGKHHVVKPESPTEEGLQARSKFNHIVQRPAVLAWWRGSFPNFGDELSPLIFEHFSGSAPEHLHPYKSRILKTPNYMLIGSIIGHAGPNTTVRGAGILHSSESVSRKAQVEGIRGFLTEKKLSPRQSKSSSFVGDPALMLPVLFNLGRVVRRKGYAVVRHVRDFGIPLQLGESVSELSLAVSGRSQISEFLHDLTRYSGVITSSLHVFIACNVFQIPSAYVNFSLSPEDSISPRSVKFRDFLSATGDELPLPNTIPPFIDVTMIEPLLQRPIQVENKISQINNVFENFNW